jgi:FkbM family methyltransferase
MGFLSRVLKSFQDGSFVFKALNRISSTKYIPSPEKEINQYLAEYYPHAEAWRKLSSSGRKIWIQFHPIFDYYRINIIAYVGANEGNTALTLNEVFPNCEFLLFEPVPQTFNILAEKTKPFKNMHCINIAVGSKEEYLQMQVDEFSPASSLLPYEPLAYREYPFLGKLHNVNVHVKPLDMVMKEKNINGIDLLIMDVQGYENEVLLGATETLKSCKVVVAELSLQAIYRGSATFDSIYQSMIQHGFLLRYLINPMQGKSHQILQIDGIFINDQHAQSGLSD